MEVQRRKQYVCPFLMFPISGIYQAEVKNPYYGLRNCSQRRHGVSKKAEYRFRKRALLDPW